MSRTVLVTGSRGFLGTNLWEALKGQEGIHGLGFDAHDPPAKLAEGLKRTDFVFHLAGRNRADDPADFVRTNVDLSVSMLSILMRQRRPVPVVFSSSVQAALDTPYGQSKRMAEAAVFDYGARTGAPVYVFRLPNVFGKFARLESRAVVATFCHNIARGLAIEISDPDRELELVYAEDVVQAFIRALSGAVQNWSEILTVKPSYRIRLGELAEKIFQFKNEPAAVYCRSDHFTQKLYLSYRFYADGQIA